jgi:hypothetical protein
MAEAAQIFTIKSLPGIKRDGTRFEGDAYVDGQWVRFQRGLPRKMGGYRAASKYLDTTCRTIHAYTQDSLTYIHAASTSSVQRLYMDGDGNTSVLVDRTPTTGFTADDNNLWQFDVDANSTTNLLTGQVAPNLQNITNSEGGAVFYGDLLGSDPLEPVTNIPSGFNATGGVVSLHPYTFVYGTNGYIAWSIPGDPTDFTGTGSGSANVASQKIIKGLPLRGGPGNSPSGIFWTADAVVRASFVGGDSIFQFDTLSGQTSILSAASVIEYEGIFFWAGVDRFLMFNGVVREVENNLNLNWFFEGLNFSQRQKVFAVKVPRFGEIWWCYPRGSATECTHAVIFNVRENTWYDCELPNDGRSAGTFPSVFGKPFMTGSQPTYTPVDYRLTEDGDQRVTEDGDYRVTEDSEDPQYRLWIHEVGTDEIDGLNIQPIYSFFETADICLPIMAQIDKAMQILRVEPDFVQVGDMSLQVVGRANARSREIEGEIITFPDVPTLPEQEVVLLKDTRREMRFRFTSNSIGGDYQMGLILGLMQPSDGRVLS